MTRVGSDYDAVRRIALALPGVEEGTSYGTPALKVKGKLMARLWEDGETLVLRVNLFERPYLLEAEPDLFFITDHYRDYPAVLLRLPEVTAPRLREAVIDSWRFVAPPKLIAAYDALAK
ncbi:MAG: MmcQ/YjbR family DNA-binding protein [Longimicrobiaceae bacterium]